MKCQRARSLGVRLTFTYCAKNRSTFLKKKKNFDKKKKMHITVSIRESHTAVNLQAGSDGDIQGNVITIFHQPSAGVFLSFS